MKYRVWCDDYDTGPEDGRVIEAYSTEDAARLWAQWHDRYTAEYGIAKGDTAIVHVRLADGGETSAFEVTGEAVPHYTATPLPKQRVRHDRA